VSKGELSDERRLNMAFICDRVVATLAKKNPKYGESWKSHGGFSAFFNTQRKWSRIENLASHHGYDVFKAIDATASEDDGMVETMLDLVGYLLLILDDRVVRDLLTVTLVMKDAVKKHRCDGEHAGPTVCEDPECWVIPR